MTPLQSIQQFLHTRQGKLCAFCLVLFLAFLGIYTMSHRNAAKKGGGDVLDASVQAYRVERRDMNRRITLSGQTVPTAQVDLSTKYGGKPCSRRLPNRRPPPPSSTPTCRRPASSTKRPR